MSTTSSIMSYSYSSPHFRTRQRYQPSFLNPNRFSVISTSNYWQGFAANHRLLSLSIDRIAHCRSNTKMDTAVRNSVQPGAPFPSGTPSNSWKSWILGMLLSIILPFYKQKWGPLLALKNEVDMVVDTVECVVDVVEKVAEEVQKVTDEVADKLPEGGKFKGAVLFVENLAKEVAKDAHLADELIEKVEEVEKGVESFIESVMDNVNEDAKEDDR